MQTSGSSCLHYFPANAGTCSFSFSTLTWCWEFGQGTTLHSPVRAQQFGMSSELCVLWNRTWFEHRNYTLLLQETILKKYLQCSVFTKHQVKYSFRWFCPCEVLKIKKLNLYLWFWGVGFFFLFLLQKYGSLHLYGIFQSCVYSSFLWCMNISEVSRWKLETNL